MHRRKFLSDFFVGLFVGQGVLVGAGLLGNTVAAAGELRAETDQNSNRRK
jgi:hypothetical protein